MTIKRFIPYTKPLFLTKLYKYNSGNQISCLLFDTKIVKRTMKIKKKKHTFKIVKKYSEKV